MGFRINKPYKMVIGYWQSKPVSISERTNRVAHGLEACELSAEQIRWLMGTSQQMAIEQIVVFVRSCRLRNVQRVVQELKNSHGWSVFGVYGCVHNGWGSTGLHDDNWLHFEKRESPTIFSSFAQYIRHERETDERVRQIADRIASACI